MSETLLEPVRHDTAYGDDLTHVCCECRGPDVALCGVDLTDAPWVDEDDDLCVVCAELAKMPCPCDEQEEAL